jgi:hypothetical protein
MKVETIVAWVVQRTLYLKWGKTKGEDVNHCRLQRLRLDQLPTSCDFIQFPALRNPLQQ